MTSTDPAPRTFVTTLGLLLALFGTPTFLWSLKLGLASTASLSAHLARELGIFLMLGALLLLIRYGERLPFSSIGWHTDRLGRTALWGLFGVPLTAAGLAACAGVAYMMNWTIGAQQPPKFTPPLWAMTITLLRAGITEEAFYRGYALERLMSLTGRKWVAVWLALIPFALFHYRQGLAGVMIAAVAGLILSWLYLKRRSLPAVMITHFTLDFVPNIVLPLFGVS